MTRRRRLGIATVLAGMAMAGATPAGAHGIGGRTDLPLPAWQLAWAAGFAVASSFVALGAFWSQPRSSPRQTVGGPFVDTRRPVIRDSSSSPSRRCVPLRRAHVGGLVG